MNKIVFTVRTKVDFTELLTRLTFKTGEYVRKEGFKPFDVTIEKHVEHKTGGQLRGFWRLCEHIAGYLTEMEGSLWDKRRVAQQICIEAGYANYYNKVTTAKTVALATKEEMSLILSNLIVLGAEMDIPDCTLTSKEEEAFNNYYKIKE